MCILNVNPPSFHLILIILPIPAVRAGTAAAALEIFPLFNEMFRFLHLPLPPYLFGFISTSPPPHSPHPSSHRPSFPPSFLPSCIVFGLSFLSLSVILLGKVIKGRHIEGALLRRVILFSRALPPFFFLSPIFVCSARPYQGEGEGGVQRDKPSMVLCGEIIWRADNARRVSSLPPLFSPLLPPPLRRKSRRGSGLSKHVYRVTPLAKCQPRPPAPPATRPYVLNPTTKSRLGQ